MNLASVYHVWSIFILIGICDTYYMTAFNYRIEEWAIIEEEWEKLKKKSSVHSGLLFG